eukprot:12606790-Ditylum_brightwellii.AAC.1
MMSLDIVNMYPSTRLSLMKMAIRHYSKKLLGKDKRQWRNDKDYMYKGVVEEIPDRDEDKNEL